jgi:hypothetical protein
MLVPVARVNSSDLRNIVVAHRIRTYNVLLRDSRVLLLMPSIF